MVSRLTQKKDLDPLLQSAKLKVYQIMKFSGPADPGFSIPLDLVGFVGCFLTCGMLQRVREHTSPFSASAIFWITAEAEFFCQSKSLQDAFCETRTWLWPPGA